MHKRCASSFLRLRDVTARRKAAHVPADGHRFLDLQLHKPLDQEHALLAVTIGEQILHAVAGHLFPLAGGIVLHIAGALFVVVGLA